MALLYTLTMAVPFLRDFFELDLPPSDAMAWVVGASLAGGLGVIATTYLFDDF